MRAIWMLLVVGLALAATVALGIPAGADCGGPTLTFAPHDADRGDTVALTGTSWGDNCYDTGRPPEGESMIGRPIANILVVLQQGGRTWELWSGSANDAYEFAAEVTVPVDSDPGEATVTAHWGRPDQPPTISAFTPDPTLRISAAPPPSTTSGPAVVIPPPRGSAADAPAQAGSRSRWPVGLAGGGAAGAVGLFLFLRSRRAR